MSKYNINIGNLSREEQRKLQEELDAGNSVAISGESADKTKTTVIKQTVVQYGEYCYNFTEPVSGFHIGDTYGEKE